VGEALGHQQREGIVGGQFDHEMPAEGRRRFPNVDAHVEDRTVHATHELVLLVRRALEVHAAQDVALPVGRQVGLHELRRQAAGGKRVVALQALENAALVAEHRRFDQHQVVQRGGQDPHGLGPMRS